MSIEPEVVVPATMPVPPAAPPAAVLPPEIAAKLRRYEQMSKGVLVAVGLLIGYVGRGLIEGRGSDTSGATAAAAPVAAPAAPQAPGPQGPPPQPLDAAKTLERLNRLSAVTVIGNPNAKAVIHEFTDIQCPACAAAARSFLPEVKRRFVETGQARLVLVHWPLPIHPNAPVSGAAVLCATAEGKGGEMAEALFTRQAEWASLPPGQVEDRLVAIAKDAKVPTAGLRSCMTSGKYDGAMREAGQAASDLGAPGTPTFFINGQRVSSPQQFDEIIAQVNRAKR